MELFANLFTNLDQTNKTNAKIQYLVEYLDQAKERDKIWALAMFSGKRPRRALRNSLLREWVSEMSEVPVWLLEESYHVVGDLAETIALILPPPTQKSNRSLADWMDYLLEVAKKDEPEQEKMMKEAWQQLDAMERFVFNKLITGGFRLGVSQKLLVRALSQQTGMEANVIAHRLMGDWNPSNTSYQELLFSENIRDDISKPYPFYLAYALEEKPETLGSPDEWQAEWKWDGIRSQFIKRKDQWFLWSRGEELITNKFPELAAISQRIPNGTVIDGEILPFKEGQPLSFNVLQTRIGRKNITKKILESAPVVIMAYDLMEWEEEDTRSWPFIKRRTKLAEIVDTAGIPSILKLSPDAPFSSWDELAHLRSTARSYHSEGLMLKKLNSDYKVGRKRGDWWKWKVDPLTIDAVMIYAQRGHGRRANLYSDYTFAVWSGDQLVPFTKAYSGLTDKEMRQVDNFVKRNTLERFGPVRSVKPELVFEIGFEGINASSRHKSGVALRFPRMLRWRTDKPAEEADTLETLHKMLKQYG